MIEQIPPSGLADWYALNSAAQPVLLDVRLDWERKTASVTPPGVKVVAIPLSEIPERLGELDPAQRIACLCHVGGRSQRVALFLERNGFAQLANIVGGIDAWSIQQDPSIRRY